MAHRVNMEGARLNISFMLVLVLLMTGCSPSAGEIQKAIIQTRAAEPIDTPMIVTVLHTVVHTEIAEVVVTQEVTKIIERPVTVSPTDTPLHTPTITSTPTNTSTPEPTAPPTVTPDLAQTATLEALGALAAPKGDGFYTVGVEILAGKWHSTGIGDGCYWARLDSNQNTINNHFGIAGGTVNISATDFEVEFDGCGIWEYVENAERVLAAAGADPKDDGFYTVGVEISPGTWQSNGTGDGCYWARLDANQNILDNHFGNAGGSVTIGATDYEVEFGGCGTWNYVGP